MWCSQMPTYPAFFDVARFDYSFFDSFEVKANFKAIISKPSMNVKSI